MPMSELIALAKPLALATHARVIRNTGVIRNVEYYPLSQAANVILQDGDELEFTADKRLGSITVRVEGEHESPQEYGLPYGTRSEEHKSELQSLMRISYAVFCLKTKIRSTNDTTQTINVLPQF